MPFVFVHGVNTRDGPEYRRDVACRDALWRELVLDPLAARDARCAGMAIANPYWGDLGVQFRWDLASLPQPRVGRLGPAGPLADDNGTAAAAAADELAGQLLSPESAASQGGAAIGRLGAAAAGLRGAAATQPLRAVEAFLAPVTFGALADGTALLDPAVAGEREADLIAAGVAASADGPAMARVAAAATEAEAAARLAEAIGAHLRQEPAGGVGRLGPGAGGGAGSWLAELVDRAADLPLRAASQPLVERYRAGAHERMARFIGDVFVYLDSRGSAAAPGPIVMRVAEALRAARRAAPRQPLVVVAHSMGANIVYDLVTHFAPDIAIDAWITVGSQVAQFEEMKLFRASDAKLGPPSRVGGVRARVGYWLNVYDRVDLFGMRAGPVFADVDADVEYATGSEPLKSHGAYFKRGSFYRLARTHVALALAIADDGGA